MNIRDEAKKWWLEQDCDIKGVHSDGFSASKTENMLIDFAEHILSEKLKESKRPNHKNEKYWDTETALGADVNEFIFSDYADDLNSYIDTLELKLLERDKQVDEVIEKHEKALQEANHVLSNENDYTATVRVQAYRDSLMHELVLADLKKLKGTQ